MNQPACRSRAGLPRFLCGGLALLFAGILLLVAACGTGPRPQPEERPGLPREERERAERLFRQLEQEHSLHRDRRSLELAYELIDHYQGYARLDEAMLIATRSARRLGDLAVGRRLVQEFLQRHPRSGHASTMLTHGMEMAATAGDTLAAADLAVQLYDRQEQAGARKRAAERAALLLERLTAEDLAQLSTRYPGSGLWPFISFLHTQRLVEAGRREEAGRTVASLREIAPASEWLAEAERLLSEPVRRPGAPGIQVPGAGVSSSLVGVLCPLTGRYAVLGNAFYDGALLALQVVNGLGWRQFELKVEDTDSDPVSAALATRRLAGEEGAIALIGSLMSAPTAAVAVVADLYRVPLVSPTATNERIWELGSTIFQTNLTALFEARLLARLATHVLLKERFAILYPGTRDGARSFQVFSEEVRACGGSVVGSAAFAPDNTDFRKPLQDIRQARPEVVFIHASVDQMILLGPQLDFYRVGALVMGPSSWNAPKLLRKCGTLLERAVFPSDTALSPSSWIEDFYRQWRPEHLPEEATPLALKAYQATRLVLDTLARQDLQTRQELTAALRERLESQEYHTGGLDALTGAVRMYSGGEIVPFPTDIFRETWQTIAAADTTLLFEEGLPPARESELLPTDPRAPLPHRDEEPLPAAGDTLRTDLRTDSSFRDR